MKSLVLFLLCPFGIVAQNRQLDSLHVDYPLFLHFGTPAVWTEPTDSTASCSFSMVIDTSETYRIEGHYLGHRLQLINATDEEVGFWTSNGEIFIRAEAFVDGTWKPFTIVSGDWCGNSYRCVSIPAGTMWEFDIPVFTGPLHTQIRYAAFHTWGTAPPMCVSNAVNAYIDPGQLDGSRISDGDRSSMIALPGF